MIKILSVFTVILCALILVASFAFAVNKGQNIVKLFSDSEINSDMTVNDIVSLGGDVVIRGRVEGNVTVVWGSIKVSDGSYVGGQVIVVGGELFRGPESRIEGRVTQIYMPDFIPSLTRFLKNGWIAVWAIISFFVLLGFLGLAVLAMAFIPGHMSAIVDALGKSFFISFLWGMFWMVLIVPIAVFLLISIVGIVLIPLEILIAAAAFILGYIASAIFIGKKVFASLKKNSNPFFDAILGIVILLVAGFIPVVGTAVKTIFVIAGFGAVLTTRFGVLRKF